MKRVSTDAAPQPVGPYSQAVIHDGIVYVSGQVALDPATGRPTGDTIEEQAERILDNLRAILEAAGSDLSRLLRVTVYVADIAEFARFNAIYERHLGAARPARTTIQAGALPLGLRVEIDAIAAI